MKSGFLPLAAGLILAASSAHAETTFAVRLDTIADQKAVFATVESPYVVPARSRIGGTVATLSVRPGDLVTQGQVIAVVADEKLLLQIASLDAEIGGLQSALAGAKTDLNRAETLAHEGAGPRATMDQARTAAEVATSTLRSRTAQRSVMRQTLDEGQVLAPVAGRILTVPLTTGSVVMNGDMVATVAEQPFRLRLRVPERHAVTLRVGDPIRLDARQLGAGSASSGTVTLIYPQIEGGRVVADATVDDLNSYFAGDRVLVWIGAGERKGYVVPAGFVETRFGLDYVRLRGPDGGTAEIPVQRGEETPMPEIQDGLELLSGVRAGDILAKP